MHQSLKLSLNVAGLILYATLSLTSLLALSLYLYDYPTLQNFLLLPLLLVSLATLAISTLFGFSYLTFRLQRQSRSPYQNGLALYRLNHRLALTNGFLTLFVWPIFLITSSL